MARYVLKDEATAARRYVYFQCVDATDGITPETGEAAGQPQISTNGGAFTNTGIGTLTHLGNGRYYAALTTGAVATAGDIIETRYKSANTAESVGDTVVITTFDFVTAIASTGDSFARLGAPAGASIAADIAALPQVLASGTADSGTTTTMVDAARTEADTDYWADCMILFTSGTLAGQCRIITAFTPGTDTITFTPATTQAVSTHAYRILPKARSDIALWRGSPPNNLVSSRVDSYTGAFAASVIDAAALAADAGAEIADAVWDEVLSGHTTAGSAGASLGAIGQYVTGTADSGTTSSFVDAARTEADDEWWVGYLVRFTSGTLNGQVRVITSFNATTDTISFSPATTQVVSTHTYEIFPGGAAWLAAIKPSIITSTAFTAGAITASVIAADAIGASELAADAVAEIADAIWDEARAGHVAAGSFGEGVASVQGNVTGSVASVTAISAGAITAASIATDAIDADAIAADAASEIAAAVSAPSAATIADAVWDEARAGHVAAGSFGEGVDLMDGAITAATIATGAVDADALAADAVTEIAAGLPTNGTIADAVWDEARAGHVAAGSFGEGVASVQGSVASVTALAAGSITAAVIATDAIDADAIAASAVTEIAAGITTPPTAAAIADAVWDEILSGHLSAGSTGSALNGLSDIIAGVTSALAGYESRRLGRQKVRYDTTNDDNPLVYQLVVDGVKVTPTSATITIYRAGSTTALVTAATMTVSTTLMTYSVDTTTEASWPVEAGYRADIVVTANSKTYERTVVFDVVKYLLDLNIGIDQLIAMDDGLRGMAWDSNETFGEVILATRDVLQARLESKVLDEGGLIENMILDNSRISVAARMYVLSVIWRAKGDDEKAKYWRDEYETLWPVVLSTIKFDSGQDGSEDASIGGTQEVRLKT